ncbi:MAG: acyl-CoA thioesterase [Acidobacteriota bacterium]|nr:acyl-CoA thioesterase [Acidobacteriota bacterium]
MTPIYIHQIEVRFVDCDPMGHVNNAVYLSYLEQARFGLWRRLWGFTGESARTAAGGTGLILARVECDFRAAATYGDVLEVRIGLNGIGRTSFTYDYEIADAATGRLMTTARTVLVCYDYSSATPVVIDAERRQALSRSFAGGQQNSDRV